MKYEMNGRYFYNYDYEDEIWYPVKGYLLYEVSNYCRVKNIQTQKILRPQILEYSKPKSLHFMLYNNGKKKTFYINTLLKQHKWEEIFRPNYSEHFVHRKGSEFIFDCF